MKTTLELNNGQTIPIIGLGTWNAGKNEVGETVKFAITEVGYRHIDCASIYGNQKEIGVGLSEAFKKVCEKVLFTYFFLLFGNHIENDWK